MPYDLPEMVQKHIVTLTSERRIAVAVSGGSDSLCLAILLHRCNYDITALLIDHDLHSLSQEHAALAIEQLKLCGIKYRLVKWDHGTIIGNIEAAARDARYRLLYQLCDELNLSVLCLAHHLDDQIETFIMNIMRGSGLNGLCAMPAKKNVNNIVILRPLLNVHKSLLTEYLINNHIKWSEDPTNKDLRLKRNMLRDTLGKYEDYVLLSKRISATIQRLQGVKIIVDRHNMMNWDMCVKYENDQYILDREYFLKLTHEEAITLISDILQKCGNHSVRGRLDDISRLYDAIVHLESNCIKRTLRKCIITIKYDTIIVTSAS